MNPKPNPVEPVQTLDDFDFQLPPELIAQHPASERSASRMLDGTGPLPVDRRFLDLPSLLRRGDLEGKPGQMLLLHQVPGVLSERVLLVGCGAASGIAATKRPSVSSDTISPVSALMIFAFWCEALE